MQNSLKFFTEWLVCPFCKSQFNLVEFTNTEKGEIYGILKCDCNCYPIVAGIPILKKNTHKYIALIKSGQLQKALYFLLVPKRELDNILARRILSYIPNVSIIKKVKHRLIDKAEQRKIVRIKNQILGDLDKKTCIEFIKYYFTYHYESIDAYNYFAHRFGLPRHLVALSFAQIIKNLDGPVLDLACGFGHITRSLLKNNSSGESPVIGLDSNFFTLYVAKKLLSPKALFVCSDGCITLPFHNNFFSAVVCVDGIHYFPNKVALVSELNRISKDKGCLMLLATRTKALNEFHGHPISAKACSELIKDIPHCILSDEEVVLRYLQKTGPNLSKSISTDKSADPKLISVIASRNKEIFKEYYRFEKWPHANGCLKINPLYTMKTKNKTDDIELVLDFPEGIYKQENSEYREYLPQEIKMSRKTLMEIEKGIYSHEINRLIEKFVIIGMPKNYY